MQKWPRRPTSGIELVLEWVAKGRTEEFKVSTGPIRPREGEWAEWREGSGGGW